MRILKHDDDCVIKMTHDDELRISVPAGKDKTAISLRVSRNGKLVIIAGHVTLIDSILGSELKEKIET